MKNKLIANKLMVLAAVMTIAVTSCAQQPGANGGIYNSGIDKATAGTVLGGVGGGIVGSNIGKGKGKTAATIGGALLGGLAGNSVGSSLDRADANYANGGVNYDNRIDANSIQNALEYSRTGQATSVNGGTITPTGTYTNANGQYCRNYIMNNYSGSACRLNNGYWAVQ